MRTQKNVSFSPTTRVTEIAKEDSCEIISRDEESLKEEYLEPWKTRHEALLARTKFSSQFIESQKQYDKNTNEFHEEGAEEKPRITLSRSKTCDDFTRIAEGKTSDTRVITTPNTETSPSCFSRLCAAISSLINI